jgi:hypothetical protein
MLQTISGDQQALQSAIGSDTQAVTTQLETDIGGLHSDVTQINNDLQSLSQNVISQVNTDSQAVQTSLSSDLTKIVNEIDTNASSLSTVVNAGNQQVLNTINGQFSTQQSQFGADLWVKIERVLGKFGSVVPPVELITPASQGGLLDSTPVGVQAVVSTDINTIASLGGKVTAAAVNNVNAGNAALAAKQYVTAYADYALAYNEFA